MNITELLFQLKQRDDVPLTVGVESTRRLFQNWLSCKVSTSNTKNKDIYKLTCILKLRYVYLHRTLYIATAICIAATHFIYCNCDMFIGTALYTSIKIIKNEVGCWDDTLTPCQKL